MKLAKKAIVLIIIGLFISATLCAQNVSFKSIDKSIETGTFKPALKSINKIIKELVDKKKTDSEDLTKAYYYKAVIDEQLENYNDYDQDLINAENAASELNKSGNADYAKALYWVAKAYNNAGLIKKSQEKLDVLFAKISDRKASDRDLFLRASVLRADNWIDQGYFIEFFKFYQSFDSTLYASTGKRDNIGGVAIKVPKSVRVERKSLYAWLTTLNIEAELVSGRMKEIDDQIEGAFKMVKTMTSKKSDYYSRLSLFEGDKYFFAEDYKKALKIYQSAYNDSRGVSYKPQRMEARGRMIDAAIKSKKESSFKSYNSEQLKAAGYYGKTSLKYLEANLGETERLLVDFNYEKALDKYNKILTKRDYKIPANRLKTAAVINTYGEILLKNYQIEKALDTLTRVSDIYKELLGEDAPKYHLARLYYANLITDYSNNFKNAGAIYKKSFDEIVAKQYGSAHPDYYKILDHAALYYIQTDEFDKAEDYLDTAGAIVAAIHGIQSPKYLSQLDLITVLAMKEGDYILAQKVAIELRDAIKNVSSGDNSETASAYETLADFKSTYGEFGEAKKAARKAAKIGENIDYQDINFALKAKDDLGKLYIKMGNYAQAENILTASLTVKEDKLGKVNKRLITTLTELGTAELFAGKYNEAEVSLSRAADIAKDVYGDKSLSYAEVLSRQIKLYLSIGDYVAAEKLAKKVLKIREEKLKENHVDMATAYTDIALARMSNNASKDEVDELLMKAVRAYSKSIGENTPQYAEALKNLASSEISDKKYVKGDSLLNVADKIWVSKLGEDNVYSADVAMLRGSIKKETGKYDKAEEYYKKAGRVYAKVFGMKHPKYVSSLSKLGQLYYVKGDYKASLKLLDETTQDYLAFTKTYFPSLSFNEKTRYWNLIKGDFEFYNSLMLKSMKDNPEVLAKVFNFTLSTKALLLNSSVRLREKILSSKNESLINKYNTWVLKKEQLSNIITLTAEQIQELGVNVEGLEKDIDQLERDLSQGSEAFKLEKESKEFTWKDVKKNLNANEYAIEVLRFRYYDKNFSDSIIYAGLVVSQNTEKTPKLIILPNGKELEEKYVHYYRNAIRFKINDEQSYRHYWAPFKDQLPDGATVFFSNEGVYNQLNLDVLLASDGKAAIDKNNIVLVTSTRDILFKRMFKHEPASGTKIAVLCGNPQFYRAEKGFSIAQLPGAEEEVKEIKSLLQANGWQTESYIGKNAEKDSLKDVRNPRIFHIATHGFFKEDVSSESDGLGTSVDGAEITQNPLLRSGLLMTGAGDNLDNNTNSNGHNGILTAYEAMNLYLDNTEMVVLSACETGRGEVQIGEGVYGLQRAFIVAGAQTIIMSLFKVNDDVTQALMQAFYKKWLVTGNKRKSFTDAQQEIRRQHPEPAYWGAFVMLGME